VALGCADQDLFPKASVVLWQHLAPEHPASEDLERSIHKKEVTEGFPQLLTHRDTWQDTRSGNCRNTDAVQAPSGAFKKCLTQTEINARLESATLERKSSVQSQAQDSLFVPSWGQEIGSSGPAKLVGREQHTMGRSRGLHHFSKSFPSPQHRDFSPHLPPFCTSSFFFLRLCPQPLLFTLPSHAWGRTVPWFQDSLWPASCSAACKGAADLLKGVTVQTDQGLGSLFCQKQHFPPCSQTRLEEGITCSARKAP